MSGTSYTRQSTFSDGDTITAALFNTEYNQLVSAFAYASTGTTGHQHDGGAGEGGNIHTIGDQDFNNKIVVDSTNNRWSVYVEVGGSAVEQVRIEDGVVYPVTDSDVDLGTNALRFKDAYIDSLTATGNLTIGGNIDVDGIVEFDGLSGTGSVTVTDILDQDDMSGNSATALATQQSIKAYVDSQVTAQDLDLTDGSSSISIDLDSEALSVLGGTGIDSTASGNGVTFAIDSTVTTLTGSQTLTNKTLTSPDVNTPDIDGGTIDGAVIGGSSAAAGSFTTVGATGNITVGGTVDGRDVATDGTKLDGIEASATADQTNAEIRTAVEAATDSNVFTDADHSKLNAIEASADVTDTANVTAAGALMDSELTAIASVKALNQGVATTDSPTFAAVTVNGNVEFDGLSGTGSVTVTDILDQDDMSGNSATALATQQSIKAYVDAQQDTVDTLAEILANGNTTGSTDIEVTSAQKVQFRDSAIYINSSTDGQLDIVADTEIQIAATTVDLNGNLDVSGTIAIAGVSTFGGGTSISTGGVLTLEAGGNLTTASGNDLNIVYPDSRSLFFKEGSTTTLTLDNAQGATFAGAVTANAGVTSSGTGTFGILTVDDISINNASITSSGGITLDAPSNIVFDAGGANFYLKDDGTTFGQIIHESPNFTIKSTVSDGDLLFKGNDGGSTILALKLDMSAAGFATFNSGISVGDNATFLGAQNTITADDGFLRIEETDGTDITYLGDITGAGVGGLFLYNHGGSGDTILRADAASTIAHGLNVGGVVNITSNTPIITFIESDQSNKQYQIGSFGSAFAIQDASNTQFRYVIDTNGNHSFNDGTATFEGAVTANAGVVVDELTIDADTITATDDFIIDAVGEIVLDADNGGQVHLKDGGTEYARFFQDSNRLFIQTAVSDADILIRGNDGGSVITALSLDMSAAGYATFNDGINVNGTVTANNLTMLDDEFIRLGNSNDFVIVHSSSENIIQAATSDQDIIFKGNDGGSAITALTLDMSAAGAATFNSNVILPDNSYFLFGDTTSGIQGNSSSDFIKFYTANTSRFQIASDGSLFTPTAGTSNVRFGANAGNSIVSGGNYNVVVGDEAGTAITTGDDNTFVGYQAGDALNTAIRNVAIGSGALTSDTKGEASTAIGYGALYSQNFTSQTSSLNTAVGYHAGVSVTTGTQNTFVGAIAGDALTDVDFNTAVGTGALSTDTLGSKSTALGAYALANQNFTSATDTHNTAVGNNAGGSVTTGQQNTLIGSLAGDALTNAFYNVAIGYQALSGDTEGSRSVAIGRRSLATQNFTGGVNAYNTAIGYATGESVTTGVQNVLIGGDAGDALTTGSENVAIGMLALTAEDTGRKNVAIGTQALLTQNADTDNYNTAVGYFAGKSVTTGIQNVIVGGLAGDALTDADYNVALGTSSLGANTVGSRNTALGHAALFAMNPSSAADTYNTAIGFHAGLAITTGTQNTLIGGLAGDALTTGTGNIALGYNALSLDTTGSSTVAIGKSALAVQNLSGGANSFSVAIGHEAGAAITTGVQNTFIGGRAGDVLTDADYNTAVGFQTLSTDTLGSRSTAIGFEALRTQNFSSATDTYNTALGFQAGAAVTTGVQNTLIGGLAGDALTDGGTNVAVGKGAIGSDTRGSKSTAVGTGSLSSQNFTSATDTHNTAIGYVAGAGITTGARNTLIGALGGDSITEGVDNVSVGYNTLANDLKGHRSTAIGTGTLTTQQFGASTNVYNTAIGYNAGSSITTGMTNTLIGGLSGDALTDADLNVAIGYQSMTANTVGSQTVAVGSFALGSQNPSSAGNMSNTAVGHSAGFSVTTGTNNTFVGALAGDGTDDGGSNVAVGVSALTANCGSSNTAVGVSALTSSTGATNTAFGFQAGANATSANNNVFLGRDSGITGSPGGNVTTAGGILCVGDENIGAAHVQVDWTVASDARDKTDFTALDLGLDFVKALAPVTYKWDKRSKYGDKSADGYDLNAQTPDGTHKEDWLDIGFKAQEVEALEIAAGYTKDNKTNLVSSHTDDGKQMGLQYSKFVPILVKAIQEQQALIESLTARIETLEG